MSSLPPSDAALQDGSAWTETEPLVACNIRPRILIATDAWRPQVNGVVRTLEMLADETDRLGVETVFLTPDRFRTIGMPTYPEIRLSLAGLKTVSAAIEELRPDAIHVATEGPLGLLTRRYCLVRKRRFTTCYHTKYPEYLAARAPIPLSWSYAVLRRFHGAASATMVATEALKQELACRGFENLVIWRRGINIEPFVSAERREMPWKAPVFLSVGRVAVEKNLEAFLSLDLPGSKVVVGDGPARADLQRRYPDAHFLGVRSGAALAEVYASADVFVFPSMTDTFGLVMLEALAAGLPIAAYPVTGPREILSGAGEACGRMSQDLQEAALGALNLSRFDCRAYGAQYTMRSSAISFLDNMAQALEMPELAPPAVREPLLAAE